MLKLLLNISFTFVISGTIHFTLKNRRRSNFLSYVELHCESSASSFHPYLAKWHPASSGHDFREE